MRMAAKEHIEHLDNSYRSDNEIMMRQGVPVSSWTGITCQRLFDKETLTQAFRDAGITKINGIPIEKFIEVKEKV